MKKLVFLCLLLCSFSVCQAQPDYQPSKANIEARKDFQDRKFGMFIHWGIYSILGDGEWVMHNQKIPYKDYSRLASFFYPYAFDAKKWVSLAKAAGMKYITITSRHHDGFSMFRTDATPYNIVDDTHWGKDPMRTLATECHKQGIKLFFYYSLLDWGRKDYGFGHKIVDGKPVDADQPTGQAGWDHYIAFMKEQLTELLTDYGPIGGIWFDGEWEREDADWHLSEIYALIHKLQPAALIINNHHHAPRSGEDVQEFEKDLPGNNSHGWNSGGVSKSLPLESCQTMNNSWGFNINDNHYKSVKQLIHLLVKDAGMNANLLLNIGPMPNGAVQPEFIDTLYEVGQWVEKYGKTIYGTRTGFIPPQKWGVSTQKGGVQYIHVLEYPKDGTLFIPGNGQTLTSAQYFINGTKVKFKQTNKGITFDLKDANKKKIDNVIEVTLKHKNVTIPPKSEWIMKDK